MADEQLQQHLVFKGGFVGLKVYDSSRYTVDVDALVVQAEVDSTLKRARVCAETDLDDGFGFGSKNKLIWPHKVNTVVFDRPIVQESVKF